MKKSCFTLVEVVMVVALIAVLTGIAIGGYSYAMGSARESATKSIIKQMEAALESSKTKHGFYPASAQMPGSGSTRFIQLLGSDGAHLEDEDLATKWGNLPEKYIKDFRKALDFESLREYINDDGYICDAWGNPLIYTAPDTTARKAFTIRSYGPDGETGSGSESDDDITN
ncbi:MAG: type II secretion system protein GspG [Lentisphaeria bacterium]|nr:type II secretion system protein GspG [Lentisphaeria bacterium]